MTLTRIGQELYFSGFLKGWKVSLAIITYLPIGIHWSFPLQSNDLTESFDSVFAVTPIVSYLVYMGNIMSR